MAQERRFHSFYHSFFLVILRLTIARSLSLVSSYPETRDFFSPLEATERRELSSHSPQSLCAHFSVRDPSLQSCRDCTMPILFYGTQKMQFSIFFSNSGTKLLDFYFGERNTLCRVFRNCKKEKEFTKFSNLSVFKHF